MTLNPLLPRLLWIIMFCAILAGFTFVSWGISRDYFEYRTASYIAIKDYREGVIKAPAILVCIPFWPGTLNTETKVGDFLSGKFFNDQNDTWRVHWIWARIPGDEMERYGTKKYITRNLYCLFVKMLNSFSMAHMTSPRYVGQQIFYKGRMSVTPIHARRGWNKIGRKECNPEAVYFRIVTDESSLSRPRVRFIMKYPCRTGYSKYFYHLTYSSWVSVKLPPPFDTNCLDYQREGSFLSSHDCYDECLKEGTKKWNVITDATFIEKERFKNSKEYLIRAYFLEDQEKSNKTQDSFQAPMAFSSLMKTNLSDELQEAYLNLKRDWKIIKKSCRQSCSRPDCWSEEISPNIPDFHGTMGKNATLQQFEYLMLMSHQPTIEVSTIPKQRLLDYVIYMLSNLSFWIGFCPLALAGAIERRLQNCSVTTGNTEKTLEQKVLRQERRIQRQAVSFSHKIRTLEERFRHLYEERITTLETIIRAKESLDRTYKSLRF